MKKMNLIVAVFAILSLVFQAPAFADAGNLTAMVQSLQKQMGQMQNTIDWQNKKLKDLEKNQAAPAVMLAEPAGDFKENLIASIDPAHKWLKGMKFYGDFRLRYEGISSRDSAPLNDRNRFRYRLRFGWEKTFSEELKIGWRLVSADINGISSTNTTLDSGFRYKSVSLDKAFATYTPNWAKTGPVKSLEITGGKFANPFRDGSSDMIWDSDVTPEGLYQKAVFDVLKSEDWDLDMSLLAGQLIIEEGAGSDHDDAELWAFQAGFDSKVDIGKKKPVKIKNKMSWYNYSDFTLPGNYPIGTLASGNFTSSRLGGAYLAPEDFSILEFYNEVWVPLPYVKGMKLYFDYAWNTNEGSDTNTGAGQNDAWAIGTKIGKAKKKGGWELSYAYKNIESGAVPGIYADSDFGGADRRGSVIKAKYALTDYMLVGASAFLTNRISADALSADNDRKVYQVDMIWKF